MRTTDDTKYIPIIWAKSITIMLDDFEDDIA